MSKIKLMRKNNSIYILVVITIQLIIYRAACMQIGTITIACSDRSAGALQDDDGDAYGTRLFVRPAQH
jgi:hypothetical protein